MIANVATQGMEKLPGSGEPRHKELAGRTQETQNWGGVIISVLVIIFICGSVVSVALIVSKNTGIELLPNYEFEDIFESSLNENAFQYHWISESVYISKDDENNLVKHDVMNNDSKIVLENRAWNEKGASEFYISPMGDLILLACHKVHLYGQSYSAIYQIYNITDGKLLPALKPDNVTGEETRLRYAGWSPNKNGSSLIFVYKNNIYYKENVRSTPRQITTSGKENLIFNGVPDIVFAEEIIDSDHAIYWFNEGGRFVYATFDNTGVDVAWVPKYDYLTTPEVEYFPYPKPGGTLPTVSLHVYDLKTDEEVHLTAPSPLVNKDHFFKYVVWIDQSHVSVTWLNRSQDYAVISICDVNSGGVCAESMSQDSPDSWVVLRSPPVFAEDNKSYAVVWALSDRDDIDHHYHVHIVYIQDGEDKIDGWTEGKYDVSKIVAYHAEEKEVYYLANSEKKPWQRHLYRLNFGQNPRCLSCDLGCDYYDAEIVSGTSKYVLYCEGPGVPNSTFHEFNQTNHTILEANTDFSKSVYSKVYIIKESHVFDVRNKQIPVQILQHNKKDEHRHHPLLINIIDEAGSSMVTSKFYQGWFTYLASRYHVITAHIDVRGSSGFGRTHLHAINRNIGKEETEDLISVTEFIRNSSLGVVSFNGTQFDQTRIALIGQGYGGFLASMAYAKSTMFNCSIAVSPITDWRHYSAIFTEKYMDMPTAQDNLQGYTNANLSYLARSFRNNTFLLAHGMADKTVHFQHSANLVQALVEANIQFKTLFYPDKGHELWTSNLKTNIYQSLTNFLVKCLKLGLEDTS